ncbi:cilia- and flagella-associated protein 410 isoform X2 [Nematostella vectensis]|uniref:cilia- and flagella-associated protein 410 isoform X2 n=1 Tax=Nematostella vectensis TaxID=45351 RepID=UPI002076DBD9|nr:cilia- and flagella-associated protein 410 isoform X2 [Nematostella vectensis]
MSKLNKKQVLGRSRAKSLESVKNLNFWGSSLSDVSLVRELPNVEVLSLSVNSIASLKDFAFCPRLKELYLRRNCINDLKEIGFLKKLPKLRVLWLSDNPCCTTENYRETVLKNLPRLIRLDNVAVDDTEPLLAKEKGAEIDIPDGLPDHVDLGETISSTMGSTRSTDPGQSIRKEPPDQRVPSVNNEPDVARESLVDKTNKLRAELGLKPLVVDEPKPSPKSPTKSKSQTDSRPSSSSSQISETRSNNILTAVCALVKELDRESLEEVKLEVEKRLHDCSSNAERDSDGGADNKPLVPEMD